MGSPTNPVLDEINGLSPGAKAALQQFHQSANSMASASPTPAVYRGADMPGTIPQQPMQTMPPPAMHAPTSAGAAPMRGTLEGDKAAMTAEAGHKPALENVYGKITNSGFGQAHPVAGKILGALAQIPATGADIALSGIAPKIGALTPGTTAQHSVKMAGLGREVAGEEANKETEARIGLQGEQTNEARVRADEAAHPSSTPLATTSGYSAFNPKTGQATPINDTGGNQLQPIEKPGAMQHAVLPDGTVLGISTDPKTGQPSARVLYKGNPKDTKPDTPEQQYIDHYEQVHKGSTVEDAIKAYAADTQKPERPERPQRQLMLMPDGKGGYTATEVLPGMHVDSGAVTPSGSSSMNVKDEEQKAAQAKAQQDAQNEYKLAERLAANPSPTNDVALVMRYIGATKPDSLGKLRLNQNEISLVMGTRSSFGDLEAFAEKVQNGQKLTPEQRQDMLNTMKILAGGGNEGSGPMVQHSPSTGQYRYSMDGGKTWQAGQPPAK